MEAKDKMSLAEVGLILILLGGLTIFIAKFIKLGREKKIEMINEWLLLAVVQAEKELGNGTGQIKLRFVYDMFIAKFKYASMMISFNQFSLMVDSALDKMRQMLSDNNNLKAYVDGQ
jgi:hypothetical protein